MILSHLCDEPKGLKTNMCMVWFVQFSSIKHLWKVCPYALIENFEILVYITIIAGIFRSLKSNVY